MMPLFRFLERPEPRQAEGILRIYQNEGWWGDGPADLELIHRIVSGSHCFLLVTEDDAVIGMGRALSDGVSDAYIQDVAVLPSWRGQGVGSGIIQRVVDRLHGDGLSWIGLIAERRSSSFYRRTGFEPMADALPMLLQRGS